VRNYCRVIARHLQDAPKFRRQVDDEYVGLIYQTSPLHDIGKVAIPDPHPAHSGPLTAEEFEINEDAMPFTVRQSSMPRVEEYPGTHILEMARDIALGHHEKYNGRAIPAAWPVRKSHSAPASWLWPTCMTP